MSYFFVVCIALTLFFSFSLILKKDKTVSEHIFVAWIVLLAATELSFFFQSLGLYPRYIVYFSIICNTHLMHGVFFFMYVKSFTTIGFRLKIAHLLHLTPFFLLLGLKFLFNDILHVIDCDGAGCIHENNKYVDLLSIYKFGIIGGYLFAGWHLIHHFRQEKENNEEISSIRKNWIYNVWIGVLLLFIFSLLYKLMAGLGFAFLGNEITVINVMVSFFILIFLYMGNSYAYIFVSPLPGKNASIVMEKHVTKPENSTIENSIVDLERKFNLIDFFNKKDKPFLKGQFTIREMSEKLKIPASEISQIVYQSTGKHYCDYMNAFRVIELKEKLENPDNDKYTIIALATDCGFNSKTSFNRIFKQFTGYTPSEYRVKIQTERN